MTFTTLSYATVIVFMSVIMKKETSPFTALVIIPLCLTAIAMLVGVADKGNIDDFVLGGVATITNAGIMLLLVILYFSIMLDTGLLDPTTRKMIYFAKGDPMKVLVATVVVATAISLNGDGTTTTLICCSVFILIYKKLKMKMMNLGVLTILQNTTTNLFPRGGPTIHAMAVLEVDADILTYLLPGMSFSLPYVILFAARRTGKQERARLGITELTDAEIKEMTTVSDPDMLKICCSQNFLFNTALTILLIDWLAASSFIPDIALPPILLFSIGACIVLMVNYPVLKEQSERIGANGGDAAQVVILVFTAGIFMGLFQGPGMATALANSPTHLISQQLVGFWGLVAALTSTLGTFFISNDGFYFGVLPVLVEAGCVYGFTNMQMALAPLLGQAFHLLSPLAAFICLLLRLTGLSTGQWQKEAVKYALGIFIILVVTIILLGHMPLYIPQ